MLEADKVPKVLWQYVEIIDFMNENPGMYHMDSIRQEAHNEVAKYFGVEREEVTKALEESDNNAVMMYNRLKSQ